MASNRHDRDNPPRVRNIRPRALRAGQHLIRVPVPYWTFRLVTKVEAEDLGNAAVYRYRVAGVKHSYTVKATGTVTVADADKPPAIWAGGIAGSYHAPHCPCPDHCLNCLEDLPSVRQLRADMVAEGVVGPNGPYTMADLLHPRARYCSPYCKGRAKRERALDRRLGGDHTRACWTPVACPACGNPLPPRGRSVPLAMHVPACCDRASQDPAVNPRHLWNREEA